MPLRIGKPRHQIDVAAEYERLASDDERVAKMLKQSAEYRHAAYFYIQAMEKYIRSKIFTLVNPNLEYFRNRNRNHSLESAIEFLLEIITADPNVRKQVQKQITEFVLGDINYQHLHNNLRYPTYSPRYNSYSQFDYSLDDCNLIEQKLTALKSYLQQLQRL